jgi:GxxExxY protein
LVVFNSKPFQPQRQGVTRVKRRVMTKENLNRVGGVILDAAITVHRELGPGLLESAYELALARELILRDIRVRSQVPVELTYKGISLGKAYIMDILVEEEIVIEVKSAELMNPIFESQLITYLKLGDKRLGYLINFNVTLLKNGFRRLVYQF